MHAGNVLSLFNFQIHRNGLKEIYWLQYRNVTECCIPIMHLLTHPWRQGGTILHFPYLPNLTSCTFGLVGEIKFYLADQCTRREEKPQTILDSIHKKEFIKRNANFVRNAVAKLVQVEEHPGIIVYIFCNGKA